MAGYLPEYMYSFVDQLDEHPWLFAGLASILVGLSGIFPLLIIPLDATDTFTDGPGASMLRILLSFAVGGLLGDVFLHLLPEAWQNDLNNTKPGEHVSLKSGLWCLCGMLVFIVVEKLFAATDHEEKEEEETQEEPEVIKQNGSTKIKQIEIEEIEKLLAVERRQRGKSIGDGICDGNGTVTAKQLYDTCVFNNNTKGICCNTVASPNGTARSCNSKQGNRWMGRCLLREAREQALKATKEKSKKKDVAGYLNLMANSIDNFTHGLAVGGSFLVGFRVGVLTTFAILVHEIPHEVGDFAILLKSGFSRWEAAKAQLATAAAGLIGAMTAVIFSGARNSIGVCCNTVASPNGTARSCNSKQGNRWMGRCLLREAREQALKATKEKSKKKDVAGYLNLMANSIDNFTHGLAVGGSFLVGFRVGVLTTFAILVHEIPHEVGDFAILLKSGFSRWEAAKAQLATAAAGLIGAMTAVIFSGARNSIEAKTSWIVPFTAGGFLHIALVTVLPDLLREPDKMQSLKHLGALVSGIVIMAFMTYYFG